MSKFPSWFPTTLSFATSPLPPSLCFIPFPLTPSSPSLSNPDLIQVCPDPTISSSPAIPYVAPPPYIAPLLSEWKYTGWWYSGGVGLTSPPPPYPLPSLNFTEVGRPTCPSCPSSAAYSASDGPPCFWTCPGSPQSWGTLPKYLLRTGVSPIPPTYKSYQMSMVLIPPSLRLSTSAPTESATSSDFQPLLASCHMNLWEPYQGIWTPTLFPKVLCMPERPLPCSSVTLPPAFASDSSPLT